MFALFIIACITFMFSYILYKIDITHKISAYVFAAVLFLSLIIAYWELAGKF